MAVGFAVDITMIKSMTGYGRSEIVREEHRLTVEMKSVNHRYLDLNIKMPKKFNAYEAEIRNILKDYFKSIDFDEAVKENIIRLVNPFNDYIDSIMNMLDIDSIKEKGLNADIYVTTAQSDGCTSSQRSQLFPNPQSASAVLCGHGRIPGGIIWQILVLFRWVVPKTRWTANG